MGKKAQTITPLVSTGWLEEHLRDSGLIILDIRNGDEYQRGHIPGAINAPSSLWSTARNGLFLELPDDNILFNLIGGAGINGDSAVVICHKTSEPPKPASYPLADAARVADTLMYAGINNLAILDGGHTRWGDEGRLQSADIVMPEPIVYRGEIKTDMFVTLEYVQEHIGKSVILDTRDPDVYFGVTIEPTADKAGHIPGAICLPAPWIWNADGTYKKTESLCEMASGVLGKQAPEEIIIYCGVGGYASAWWFVLTRLLGYANVKFYDGSAQEWVKYNDMVKYTW